jgi:hypothetical protein
MSHDAILQWAVEAAAKSAGEGMLPLDCSLADERTCEGIALCEDVKRKFAGKYAQASEGLRILIHLPPLERSPGGHSLFRNLAESLQYIGIPTRCATWADPLTEILGEFRPSVLLTSDSPEYLGRIDWRAFSAYRSGQRCRLGLTASIQEYGNTPLPGRLQWAAEHGVDFYYSFRAPGYFRERPAYRPFFEEGFQILSVEFGANPLLYYPIAGIKRDLDYVFLASSNYDKRARYYEYLSGILAAHPGFINGPGWRHSRTLASAQVHRFLYARARVGLNLHIYDSIDWPSELNERTYILAACGVPQVVDSAQLLSARFSAGSFFIGTNPREYRQLFDEVLASPDLASQRAALAQREVFSRHTTFHRAESLVHQLKELSRAE